MCGLALISAFCLVAPSPSRAEELTTDELTTDELTTKEPTTDELTTNDGTQLTLQPMSASNPEDVRLLSVLPTKGTPESHDLSEQCGGGLPYVLGPIYEGEGRHLVAVRGRYCFYLYNLRVDTLLGPFSPSFSGEGEDSQSGMVVGLTFGDEGLSIMGFLVDSGPFLFSLQDLSGVTEVPSLASHGGTALFAWSYPSRKKFRVMRVREEGWQVTFDEVGNGLRLERDAADQIVSKSLDHWVLLFGPKTVLAVDLASKTVTKLETALRPDDSDDDWRKVLPDGVAP